MTLRGNRRSRNPFVGHTTSGILHHARCDVLILNRLALAGERVPRILIPTFRPTVSPKSMRIAEELSVRGGGVSVITLELGARPDARGPVPVLGRAEPPGGPPLSQTIVHFPGRAGAPALGSPSSSCMPPSGSGSVSCSSGGRRRARKGPS